MQHGEKGVSIICAAILRLRFGMRDERKLFCARDHFGIKPFFYSASERQFLFSNTLNCLRAHPDVSDELNEAAIGDFLLFGLNCEIATTTFRDIQRLPPAHFMVVTAHELRTQRYWSPPIDGRIRYSRPEEYVEHFREILKAAVADRLRTDRVGIFLSGGFDSGSIAAMARELSSSAVGAKELRAYTTIFEPGGVTEKRVYARATADSLQIPVELLPSDTSLFKGWDDTSIDWPEPVDNPFLGDVAETFRQVGSACRVAFSGEGADNLMDFQMWPYVKDLYRNQEWRGLTTEMARFLWLRPFPWRGIIQHGKGLLGFDQSNSLLPDWIEPNFSTRLGLEERYKTMRFSGPRQHPVVPRAHASLTMCLWSHLFENADGGTVGLPIEVRYPFLDIRLVDFLLALPPFPWFFKKNLIRKAMARMLPGTTIGRPKTPLTENPVLEAVRRKNPQWAKTIIFSDAIRQYVRISDLVDSITTAKLDQVQVIIRPLCLNFWLQGYKRLRYNLKAEVRHA